MKKTLVRVLWVSLAVLMLAGAVWLWVFSHKNNRTQTCRGVECKIHCDSDRILITEDELKSSIEAKFGKLSDRRIENIDLKAISEFVKQQPCLTESSVKMDVDGTVAISARQYVPMLRLMPDQGRQAYLSEEGVLMPVSALHICRLPVATGDFSIPFRNGTNLYDSCARNPILIPATQALFDLHYASALIQRDTILDALIEQIIIEQPNHLQLITAAGSHTIRVGDTTLLQEKLENLKIFYKQALTKLGWNKYHTLSLEYQGQVVGSK